MATRPNVDVHKFVRHINVGLRRYGLADRNGNLKWNSKEITIADGDGVQRDGIKRIVLAEISGFFNISERRIRKSTERGHVTEARVAAIILLARHAKMTSAELARLFDCSTRLINQRLATFAAALSGKAKNAGIKNYGDKLFLHKVNKINVRIKERIESLTYSHT